MTVKAKPDGYHSVTPYLVVDGAARLIDFMAAGVQCGGGRAVCRAGQPHRPRRTAHWRFLGHAGRRAWRAQADAGDAVFVCR